MTFADRQTRLNVKTLKRFGDLHLLNGVSVQGDFVKPGKKFTLNDVTFEAHQPMLVVADGDVPADPVGLPAVCEAVTYTMQDVKPDGHGMTVIYLQTGL